MYKVIVTIICSLLLINPLVSYPAEPLNDSNPTQIKLRYGQFDPLVKLPNVAANYKSADSNDLKIIQLNGVILKEWQENLTELGIRLYNYLPDNAYLAKLDQEQLKTVASLPFVRWIGNFEPAYKIEPTLLGSTGEFDLIIQAVADDSAVASKISALGLNVTAQTPAHLLQALKTADDPFLRFQTLAVKANLDALPQLAALDSVVWIEKRLQYKTSNNTAAMITQGGQPNQFPIWQMGITGAGASPSITAGVGSEQIIAVGDTGVDLRHVDFGGVNVPNATVLGITNWGAAHGSADETGFDTHGHGTHVAGTVAGSGTANGGEIPYNNNSYKGIAYGARLYIQQLGSSLNFLNDTAVVNSIIQLMIEAKQKGAHIQNNSWGDDSTEARGVYDTFAQDADTFMWLNKDFLGVWAAGNAGFGGPNTIGPPGTAKNIVSVGATVNTINEINAMAAFSSRGPTVDGRIKPDVSAPGQCLMSAETESSNQYWCLSGTSMASPVVAGSAALLRDWYINRLSHPNPQAALIKATLVNSAFYMGGSGAGGNLPQIGQGWGRVNLQSVMTSTSGATFAYADNTAGLNTGETATYIYNVNNTNTPLKISLAWTDAPATANATQAAVNDLNLQLIAPDGTTKYWGNNYIGQYSQIGQPAMIDDRNNVEQVTIQVPTVGNWKVVVNARNVPVGKQPFALAIQGQLNCSNSTGVVTDSTDGTASNCTINLRKAMTDGGEISLAKIAGNTIFLQKVLPPMQSTSRLISPLGTDSKPLVILDGKYLSRASQTAGIILNDRNFVSGLAIVNFPGAALEVIGNSQTVLNMWLGSHNGVTAAPNAYGLKLANGVSNITLGDVNNRSSGNLISGNTFGGIWGMAGNQNVQLSYNLIGYKADGTSGLKNGQYAVKGGINTTFKYYRGNKITN